MEAAGGSTMGRPPEEGPSVHPLGGDGRCEAEEGASNLQEVANSTSSIDADAAPGAELTSSSADNAAHGAPSASDRAGTERVLPVSTALPSVSHAQSNPLTRELEEIDGDIDGDDDGFVAIELATPKHSEVGNPSHSSGAEQSAEPTAFGAPHPDANFAPTADTFNQMPAVESNLNTVNSTLQPPRRRILRHPILTPLTRLPWDKIISAAGSCDALFNCKYSVRQVEDEVREEHRRIGYGEQLSEDRVGREEGYANLSLGNERLQYEEDEGSEPDELGQMGLHCLSMLDDEPDEEHVAGGNALKQPEKVAGGNRQHLAPPSGEEDVRADQRQEYVSDKQKAEVSWKQSNPSLDMMFYRTMMHEG